VVDRLARIRVPRVLSASVLVLLLLVAVGVGGGLVLPRLYDELSTLVTQLPARIAELEAWVAERGLGELLGDEGVHAQLERAQEWLVGGAAWLFSRGMLLMQGLVSVLLGLML
jgi:predicted PurR-regulated permease PerM